VPITFLGRHNPDQFEVIDITTNPKLTSINGTSKYARAFIRNKKIGGEK